MLRSIAIALSIGLLSGLFAQEAAPTATPRPKKDPRPIGDRLWFGGGIGLSFGTVTAIQLDPMVGYKVDQAGKFSVGLGGSYWRFEDNRFAPSYTFTGYGYRTFARYRFIEQLYGHAEFLHMNVERFDLVADARQRIWVPHLLLGAGYVQPLGGAGSIYFQVLFDVLQDPNSIYANQGPIFGGGIGVGF
ncbi:MAG: hypothetical protein KDB84_08850 [Flavobacteriales bacterium]|nr:hypothetical protein [Flavobacteriales bacterium]